MMIKRTLTEEEIVLACREWCEQQASFESKEVEAHFGVGVSDGSVVGPITLTFTSKVETYRG